MQSFDRVEILPVSQELNPLVVIPERRRRTGTGLERTCLQLLDSIGGNSQIVADGCGQPVHSTWNILLIDGVDLDRHSAIALEILQSRIDAYLTAEFRVLPRNQRVGTAKLGEA